MTPTTTKSVLPMLVLCVAALMAMPGVAAAQMMGDGDTPQRPQQPQQPGSDDGMKSEPGQPGSGTDMGPFHRPEPGEHNPDAGRMGQNGPAAPDFREIVEVVALGLGLDGDTAKEFKQVLLGANTAQAEAQQAQRAENQRIGEAQRQAVARLLTPEQTEKVYQVVQGLERYRAQVAAIRQNGNGPVAQQQWAQLDKAADAFFRNLFGEDRGAALTAWFTAAAHKGKGDIPQPQLIEQMGKALDLSMATIIRVQMISTSTRRLQARAQQTLDQTLRAIRDRQARGLERTLTPEQYQRLGRINLASEGYKAAMRELRRAASQPGVTREALAAQRKKIEDTAREQFRQLLSPEHYDRFMELWQRALAAEGF